MEAQNGSPPTVNVLWGSWSRQLRHLSSQVPPLTTATVPFPPKRNNFDKKEGKINACKYAFQNSHQLNILNLSKVEKFAA
jgi:hypothetical protein